MIYILALSMVGVMLVEILLMARESRALKAARELEARRELEAALEAQREKGAELEAQRELEKGLPYRREAEAPDEAVEDAGVPAPLRGGLSAGSVAALMLLMLASAHLRRKEVACLGDED